MYYVSYKGTRKYKVDLKTLLVEKTNVKIY